MENVYLTNMFPDYVPPEDLAMALSQAAIVAADIDPESRFVSVAVHSENYIPQRLLDQAARETYPHEAPYLPALSQVPVRKTVLPIRLDNLETACGCCGRKTAGGCAKKGEFLGTFRQRIYGFMHLDENGTLLGGAEYLPAELVPYPIPHDGDTAFITCVYMSDPAFDYKSAPLNALENHLKGQYAKVIAISDEAGVFPNGNLEFFIRNGYKDEGILFEDPNYCRLHLVSKAL